MNPHPQTPPPASPNRDAAAPPCFYFRWCARRAAIEKAGRSVCRACASHHRGQEYPLRGPGFRSLYASGRAAAESMDMRDDGMQRRANAEVERLMFGNIREAPRRAPKSLTED